MILTRTFSVAFKNIALAFGLFQCIILAHAQGHKDPVREIVVDASKKEGLLNKNFNVCIGAGRANEGLRADWQRQLIMVKKELGCSYLRMHGLLCDDMGVYSEDKEGRPMYNWQYIDALYDFLISIHVRPFVEFGFMPEKLATGNKTIFWWKGNVTPPKDYNKWSELIRMLVTHWTERYGEEEVKTWYFEVWNEPNLKDIFWTGNQADYFNLYEVTSQAVKSVSARYRVGGPATAGSAWIPEFIEFCVHHQVSVDFVSTHTYGVDQGYLDERGDRGTILSKNKYSVSGEIRRSRQQIAVSALPGLELHYTEWSASYTPTDPIHDSYHEASFILEKIKQSGDAANSMSYWTFTDIFEENGPRFTPFHGGFGLLNYQDIRKPAYFAYEYLNKLGPLELHNADSSSFACADSAGNIQLLLWDFTNTHPGDSVNDQVYYKRDLPAKDKGVVSCTFKNLHEGKYNLEVYTTGYRANDAYSIYLDLGAPSQLTKKQVDMVKEKIHRPGLEKKITVGSDHTFLFNYPLRENDVVLVRLTRK